MEGMTLGLLIFFVMRLSSYRDELKNVLWRLEGQLESTGLGLPDDGLAYPRNGSFDMKLADHVANVRRARHETAAALDAIVLVDEPARSRTDRIKIWFDYNYRTLRGWTIALGIVAIVVGLLAWFQPGLIEPFVNRKFLGYDRLTDEPVYEPVARWMWLVRAAGLFAASFAVMLATTVFAWFYSEAKTDAMKAWWAWSDEREEHDKLTALKARIDEEVERVRSFIQRLREARAMISSDADPFPAPETTGSEE